MMSRKVIVILAVVVVVIVAAGAVLAFQAGLIPVAPPGPASPVAAESSPDEDTSTVNAVRLLAGGTIEVDGRVVPAANADLSLSVSGIVAEILFAEGETVEAGQVILRLQADRQQAAVAQAEAQLQQARARLAETDADPREPELAAIQAQLTAAQARLLRLQSTGPNDIDASRAALAIALANYQKVKEGSSQQQIIAAEAEFANAEAVLRQAQSAYNEVRTRSDIGLRPESVQLQQATNNFNAARARLEDLRQGATEADLNGAVAQVQQARARLAALESTIPADIAAAEAEVRQVRAQFALILAGARTETIAVAEAEVAVAQAALAQAAANLAETELRAPFTGAIAEMEIAVGEQLLAGSPAVRLADLAHWQVETEDLTELQITRIRQETRATIRYDAIPGLSQPAQVTRIRPIGQDRRGDIVYTVVLTPEGRDDRLLWNMTAVVTMEPDEE